MTVPHLKIWKTQVLSEMGAETFEFVPTEGE